MVRPTARGAGLLVAGVALVGLATSMQSLTLARLGALVLGVPLVCLVWAFGARLASRRIDVVRTMVPSRPTAGGSATVLLRPTVPRLAPWTVLRERVPTALHRSGTDSHGYRINPVLRGVYRLGPATVHRSDPLNLVRWRVTSSGSDEVVVWPWVEDISREVHAVTLDAAASRPQGRPQRTLEDLTLREYRRGDDLHRVHWKASARLGELMVRHDEPSTTRSVDVVLDVGGPEDLDPASGTEWAVSACASLAVSLVRNRYEVRLTAAHRTRHGISADPLIGPSEAEVLDTFARAEALTGEELASARTGMVRRLRETGSAIIVAVLREPDAELVADLAAVGGRRRCFALVVSTRGDEDLDPLDRAGWGLAVVAPGASVADAWADVLTDRVGA